MSLRVSSDQSRAWHVEKAQCQLVAIISTKFIDSIKIDAHVFFLLYLAEKTFSLDSYFL